MIRFDPNEYYKRQIALRELGREGQERLRRSKVAVVGLGGLGSPAATYLALAGVGHLRLIDQDTVELHNLHRQTLYTIDELRYPKAEVAAKRIAKMNPEVKVEPISENLRRGNVDAILEGVDCVVDGLDNMMTRYIVNEACVRRSIPYVYAAVIGFEGCLSVFRPPRTPCLACIFPSLDDRGLPSCETRGILGATAGIVGAMEAMEAVKVLAGIDSIEGHLLICDFIDMYISKVDVWRNPKCPVCGEGGRGEGIGEPERLVWLCGRDTVNVNPREPLDLSIEEMRDLLSGKFKILLGSPFAIVFERDGIEVSLFKGGRMLMKNVKDEEDALRIYEEIMGYLTGRG
ncbi:MAG: HesA/MoeB/ThiF family protein [Candidatus Bathyarchaeia archaeon]